MSNKLLFTAAALFNWILAFGFLFFPNLVDEYLLTGSKLGNPATLYLFAGLVFTFGVGYFWASRNFTENRSVVKLGILGKILMFVMAVPLYFMGLISILLVALAFGDFIYAGLFFNALKKHKS